MLPVVARSLVLRAVSAVLVCALAFLSIESEHAAGQTPSPSPSPTVVAPGDIQIELAGQPVWYGPGDPLDLEIRVTNNASVPLIGFQVIVGVDQRVLTRSDLRESFSAEPGLVPATLPFSFTNTVAPGGSVVITIDQTTDSFATLAAALEGGVFPATVVLRTPDGVQVLDSLATPLIYYPEKPETRLNLALLLPLNAIPERGADGVFTEADPEDSLAAGIAERGWLTGFVDALETQTQPREAPQRPRRRGRKRPPRQPRPPSLRLSIAPTPRMLEELSDMADGFRMGEETLASDSPQAEAAAAILERLRSLLERDEIQPVVTPYSFPDLPTLIDRLPLEHTAAQMNAAINTLESTLATELGTAWLFPPAGRLDAQSLAQLQLLEDGDNVFLSDTSLEPPSDPLAGGCPVLTGTMSCKVEVRTTSGTSQALIADPGLTAQLSQMLIKPNDRLALQRFFAETSMIREEAPGIEGRIVQATIPSLWHPSPRLARLFLEGIREAPWIRSTTADEALEMSPGTMEARIVDRATTIRNTPSSSFFLEVDAAAQLIDSYGTTVTPDNQRIGRLRRNILVAVGRSWWRRMDLAYTYLNESKEEVTSELEKIDLSGPQAFTFTARQGELQFKVINDTGHPARLTLTMTSPNVTLNQDRIVETFPAGSKTVTVEVTARTSGQFPLEVRLETADGLVIAETTISIRSTSLNKIALAITLGALAFLILFYVLRGMRRGRRAEGYGVSE